MRLFPAVRRPARPIRAWWSAAARWRCAKSGSCCRAAGAAVSGQCARRSTPTLAALGRFERRIAHRAGGLPAHGLLVRALARHRRHRRSRPSTARCGPRAARRGVLVNSVDDPAGQQLHRAGHRGPLAVGHRDLLRGRRARAGAPVAPVARNRAAAAGLGALARLAGELREKVKGRLAFGGAARVLGDAVQLDHFAQPCPGRPRARGAPRLSPGAGARERRGPRPRAGSAWSAPGPGDPSLLTLRALQRLGEADVVLHDRLVSPAILELARRDADLIPGRQACRRRLGTGTNPCSC
jgi:hypothetical protein